MDLIVHHAKIYTVDSSFSIAEAMAVKDGKIIAIGKEDDITKKYTAAEMKDAGGKAVFPGFIDAHASIAEGQIRMEPIVSKTVNQFGG